MFMIINLFNMKNFILLIAVLAVLASAKKEKTFIDFKSIVEHVNSVQKSWKAGIN